MLASIIPFLIVLPFLIKIEQTAGYYECAECGHRYVPTFRSVFWSAHMGRTRKMVCQKCGKKSWNKKVIEILCAVRFNGIANRFNRPSN